MNTLLVRELLEPFGIARQIGDDVDVQEVLLFESGAPDAENTAYVACEAGARGRYRRALIIAIGETEIAADHLIQLEGGSVSAILNGLIQALWKLERLNKALYGASDSQEVIDIASEAIRLPLFYFDDSYRIIAISRKVYYTIDEEWRHMSEEGYLSPRTVRLMSENGDLNYLSASNEPIIFDSPLFPFSCISCNVLYKNYFKGRINILMVDRDAYQEHIEICRIVRAHLLRLIKDGKTLDGNTRLRNLLTDLLNGKNVQHDALQRTLQGMQGIGTSPAGGYQFFAIDINIREDPHLYNYYSRELERLLAGYGACVLSHAGNLVVLAVLQTQARCGCIQDIIRHFLLNQHLRCGVSHFFHDPDHMHGFYEQAVFALNSAESETLVLYEDILMDRLFAFVPDKQRMFLLSNSFLDLLEMDKGSSFPMVETLQSYLENGRSLVKTAEDLAIHKNTMLYRLNKIRECLNVDLDDLNARFALEMSILLYNSMKKALMPDNAASGAREGP